MRLSLFIIFRILLVFHVITLQYCVLKYLWATRVPKTVPEKSVQKQESGRSAKGGGCLQYDRIHATIGLHSKGRNNALESAKSSSIAQGRTTIRVEDF